MTTFLKHLKLDKMPPRTKTPVGLTITPAMQPIIIDSVAIVDP
jgi:hypothetical protein